MPEPTPIPLVALLDQASSLAHDICTLARKAKKDAMANGMTEETAEMMAYRLYDKLVEALI